MIKHMALAPKKITRTNQLERQKWFLNHKKGEKNERKNNNTKRKNNNTKRRKTGI